MPRYPWFRVYNEILTERKIERIGRMTHLPRVIIRGAWMTLLAMANDSPQRGHLMWTDDLWITEQEIADDLEMEPADFGMLLDAFVKMQMVTRHSDGLSCTNFDKRQFSSDHSTPRVRRYRERQKEQAQGTDVCNVSETLLCNGPEAETDTDPEAETEAEGEKGPPPGYDAFNPPPAVKAYCDLTNQAVLPTVANTIHARIGTDPRALDKWKRTVNAWLLRGYSRDNLTGMFDWFRDGIPKGGKGATRKRSNGRHGSEDVELSEEQKAIAAAFAADGPGDVGEGTGPPL